MTNQLNRPLMELIVKAADDRLGQDIVALEVNQLTPLADYFVIVSAKNDRQVNAIVDSIAEAVEAADYTVKGIEGKDGHAWVLIDCVDVIVHVFNKEVRSHYNIEKLWNDAPLVNLTALLENDDED
ncbi:ribosome silencing factor [Aerococcus urinae]|uniref:Ribosomal silencing factor RsfS n=1 Tax=Aerococcus urinae TaxID=1376 RepID=A0A120I9N9_9LACT|nr:ribosome silencing factor [Aerococcus urinae]AMB95515.1 ribosome-associated protein IOJAP [Aerococcus urinae]MCY3032626.1 ribosome silencing factor [Aerococcus urinae]MCY3037927.1 ribosome silencing factor [Aerococcus urinae]MCY3044672.1 ribosome silencing factor [Aerococcus urinae]MCY3045809.1 ribosome silencing factor [Aerococcus urinae]